MKFAALRPFADPAVPARRLLEIANATEAVLWRAGALELAGLLSVNSSGCASANAGAEKTEMV